MLGDGRPDPNSLLDMIKKEEKKVGRGKLTVFLGYSAGVGKTFAMLETAKRQKRQGKNVVIGVVVTHGRKETEFLTHGLEVIEPLKIQYKGITLEELNLDHLLEIKPEIALIDELAHTNVPGSRNLKRHQDVYELLNAGIDVYTTLNIQHIESMNSMVEQITKIKVMETLPDKILNEADDIKLVDIPPKDLLLRFQEGKIYVPEQAEVAVKNFFNEGNLMALRELSFRAAAEHVDEKMMEYMKSNFIDGQWQIKEKILVCVGDSKELNEKLISTGKRYADEAKIDWDVLYVEIHSNKQIETISEEALRSLELAKSLGAKTDTIHGLSVVEGILKYSKSSMATRIVVGNAIFSEKLSYFGNSTIKQLTRTPLNADIVVVTISKENKGIQKENQKENISKDGFQLSEIKKQMIIGTFVSAFILILGGILFSKNEQYWIFILLIAIIGVVICSIFMEIISSLYVAVITIIGIDVFFVYPFGTIWITNFVDIVSLFTLIPVTLIVSFFSTKIRNANRIYERRYKFVSVQHDLCHELTAAKTVESALEALERHLGEDFGIRSTCYLMRNGDLRLMMMSEGVLLASKDIMAAKWVFRNGIVAGKYTDTLSSVDMKYFPMRYSGAIFGVCGFILDDEDKSKRIEQEKIIRSSISEVSTTINRIESK